MDNNLVEESFVDRVGGKEMEEEDYHYHHHYGEDDDSCCYYGEEGRRQAAGRRRSSLTLDDDDDDMDMDMDADDANYRRRATTATTDNDRHRADGGGGGAERGDDDDVDDDDIMDASRAARSPTTSPDDGAFRRDLPWGEKSSAAPGDGGEGGGGVAERRSSGRKMHFLFGDDRRGGGCPDRGDVGPTRWGSGGGNNAIPPACRRGSSESMAESLQSSFGGSFTSDSCPVDAAVGGNLVFATDDEVARLMYGGDSDDADYDVDDTLRVCANASERCSDGSFPNTTTTTTTTKPSMLISSLPPSATLGTGSFSTVRLAWRRRGAPPKNSSDDDDGDGDDNDASRSAPLCQSNKRRRSMVNVQSELDDADTDPSLEKIRGGGGGELVAVKIIQKSILKQMKSMQRGPNNRLTAHTAFDNIEREIATMKRLRHPNLVRLYEVIDSVESDCLLMVLEYVSLGEILSHVQGTGHYTRMRYRKKVKGLTDGGHFDEKHAALFFVDIMHGLAYLHRNRICHRDLKPENILLCESGIAKISDFGVSHIFEDERDRKSFRLNAIDDESIDDRISDNEGRVDTEQVDDFNGSTTHLLRRESDQAVNMPSRHNSGMLKKTEGTYCFWSPEMCSAASDGFSGYSADLWAAGVCLYIFTTGRLPFFSMDPTELFDMISKAEVPYSGLGLSDDLRDLLSKLLEKDPSKRAGVGDCLKHEFCAQARTERIEQLGYKFKRSEEQIILSKNDVDMALSITRPRKRATSPKARAMRVTTSSVSSSAPLTVIAVPNLKSPISGLKKWCRDKLGSL